MDLSGLFETLLPSSGGLLVIRGSLAVILVFFLPGYAWTLVFFRKLKIIERIALSVGLSITTVALCIIALNVLFNVRISGGNAVIIIIIITVIPLGIYFLRRYLAHRPEVSDGD